MITVLIEPITHRGENRLALRFINNAQLNKAVRMLHNVRWSASLKTWHIPMAQSQAQHAIEILKDYAKIDASAWVARVEKPPPAIENKLEYYTTLSEHSQLALQKYRQYLTLKGYSTNTVKTYKNEFIQFLGILKKKTVDEMTLADLYIYFEYCHTTLKLTENTIHSRLNALKFYYENILKWPPFYWDIPRPKKPLLLPTVFSKAEIEAIIKSIGNNKHRAMIVLTYASGLRISEVTSLAVRNIDSQRMVIHVHRAKGKKDRVLPLSEVALKILRVYYKEYKPTHYLFEGQNKDAAYSTRSLQIIVQNAKKKAGITKVGSVHTLRHSYATHLLDKGVDITYIQKLLGHNDLKTTLRYLHVTTRDLQKIKSPVEDLDI